MTCRELLLDAALAFEQPVHGRIEVVFVGVDHVEQDRQRGEVPPAGGSQLAIGFEEASDHHGDDAVALGRGL